MITQDDKSSSDLDYEFVTWMPLDTNTFLLMKVDNNEYLRKKITGDQDYMMIIISPITEP